MENCDVNHDNNWELIDMDQFTIDVNSLIDMTDLFNQNLDECS